jgi:PAS domain S-box-containing protein
MPSNTNDIAKLKLEIELLKKENAELKQSADVFRNPNKGLIDSIPVPMFMKDTNRVYSDCNDSFLRFCGKSREEVIGLGDIQFSLDGSAALDRYDDLLLQKENQKAYEASIIDQKGRFKSFIISKKTRVDSNGSIIGIVATITDISYQKKLEEELRDNEEKYRLMSEQSMLGIMVVQDGYIKWANLAFAKIAEDSLSKIYSLPKDGFIYYVYEDDRAFVAEQSRKKQLGEKDVVTSYSFRMKTLKGHIKWCRLYSKTVNYRGNFAALVSVIDISEQVQASDEMIRSERRLREVVDMIPQFVFAMDKYGTIHLANKAFCNYFGLKSGEERMHVSDCKQQVDELLDYCEIVLDKNASLIETNFEFKGKNNKKNYWHMEIVPVDTFEVPAALGIAFDITERKKKEDQLIRMEMAVESSLTGIVLLDLDCNVLYYNPMFSSIWAVGKDEMVGKSMKTVFKEEEQALTIMEALRKEGKWSGETIGMRGDGKEIHVQMNAAVVKDSDGNERYISCATQDISERIGHELEIEKINLELELKVQNRTKQLSETLDELNLAKDEIEKSLKKEKELHQLKTNFVNMVTHEYRTPLTIILSSSYLMSLVLKESPNEKIGGHLDKIQNSVKSMTSLLDDVILISKTDHTQEKFIPTLVTLDSFLNELVEEVKILDKRRHEITVISNTFDDKIYSDSKIIKQILINLLLNSMKYSPNNSQILIKLDDNDDKESINISVVDKGIGIPDKLRDRIFEPFVRGEENIGVIRGTGLGLTIAKRFAQIIKGNLYLKDTSSKGSTFVLRLPRLKPQDILL